MKKQLLFLATIIIGFSSANAQCTISPSCTPDPNSGYCSTPADGTDLPNGTDGVAYNTVIQVSVGSTALGGAATISTVQITNVTLPAGLSYTVNPSNNTINGGSNGCIEITGTTAATVDFSVDVTVNIISSLGAVPYTISYNLTVDPSTASLNEISSNELTLFPNPAENKLTLNVNEPTDIKIVNVLGTVVLNDRIQSSKTLNVADFKNGVYFVVNESTGKTIKFIKK